MTPKVRQTVTARLEARARQKAEALAELRGARSVPRVPRPRRGAFKGAAR